MDIRYGIREDYLACKEIAEYFDESCPSEIIFGELIRNSQLLIALEEDKIVGFISYKTLWNSSLILQFLRIHPKHHRKGIASKLINEIEEIGRKSGAYEVLSTILKDNIPSKRLHEQLGYRISGMIEFDSGTEIVFLKEL